MTWESNFADYFAVRAAPLRRLAYAMSGDWHLADDLVQHTFLQVYRHWRRIDKARLDPYTRKILVNALLSHRRRFRREKVVPDPPDGVVPGPEAGEDAVLRAALDELPPKQRALIVLRYLEDISVAEAAGLLGIAEGTVKSQTARGLEKLRVALGSPGLRERING